MTGTRQPDQVERPLADLKEQGLTIVNAPITAIDPTAKTMVTGDALIVALDPNVLPGLVVVPGNFYAVAGAQAVCNQLNPLH